MRFKYFKEDEVVNPYRDGNPAYEWSEMPFEIQENLTLVMEVLDELQYFKLEKENKFHITSTWRPFKNQNSPHYFGKAIDFQIFNKKNNVVFLEIMEVIKIQMTLGNFSELRAILEYQGREPWIHLDRFYTNNLIQNTKVKLMIAYPRKNKMEYLPYEGKLPMEYL